MTLYDEKIERITKAIDIASLAMFDDMCEFMGWHVTKLIIPKNNHVMIETIHPILDQNGGERHGFSRYAWIDFSPEATEEEITQGLIANIVEHDKKTRENIGDAIISAFSQRTPIVTTDKTTAQYDHKVSDKLMGAVKRLKRMFDLAVLDKSNIDWDDAEAIITVLQQFQNIEIDLMATGMDAKLGTLDCLYGKNRE